MADEEKPEKPEPPDPLRKYLPCEWCFASSRTKSSPMKRIATLVFYAVGVLAICYLALYAYAAFTGRVLEPGDPIHIFRKPDAPNYS